MAVSMSRRKGFQNTQRIGTPKTLSVSYGMTPSQRESEMDSKVTGKCRINDDLAIHDQYLPSQALPLFVYVRMRPDKLDKSPEEKHYLDHLVNVRFEDGQVQTLSCE
ncbi:hypothetical protein HNY73_021317 [Argiope bruennichi]|uniref:Uncharacterized protein n=1 Tax=Argiope bruennichi TaxID=94029 RepID=A0A8T0DXA9_ARGBR|nr:hypothetical protein HNY73_021317 [Argiope bruennichi]